MRHAKANGFTIVELLVVIVVIVILALIITVAYRGITDRGHDTAIRSDLDSISDRIDLRMLDTNAVPAGGATSSGTGTASTFTGVSVRATRDSYDTSVTNLYYCAGEISGEDVYALLIRSKSDTQFVYRSNEGQSELTNYPLQATIDGAGVCTALGFTAPYTWSYGYTPGTGWTSWVTQ